MNVCECLAVNANIFPDRYALTFQGRSYSYRQLNDLSLAAAEVLESKGVEPGDRVAIQIGNCPAFPVWYYATLRLGAIAVSISTRLAGSERDYIVEHSGARYLLVEQSLEQDNATGDKQLTVTSDGTSFEKHALQKRKDSNTWYDANPDEPALILYTSGTTGFPKGATLSHGNVRSNVAAFNHLCHMKTEDVVLLAVPLFHCFGQNALLNSVLNVGATLVLQERFDLNESKKLIRDHKVTQLYGVPMMFQLLHEYCSADELESVEYCFSAAAPLAIQVAREWQDKFGMPIHEGYGLTETSPFASYNHRNRFVAGSIGMPIDSVEMKIVDPESGQEREPDTLGEIAIRGPNVMLGYWNQPEETDKAIRDGWFLSGDIGKQDSDGYFYIVDRVKDMIAVGGMKVFPAEVERVLRDQKTVLDAAVVGIEESVLGEQVVGFVVLESDVSTNSALDQIHQSVRRELADYKVPRRLFELDELPRNPSGKILKTRLREMAVDLMNRAEDLPLTETAQASQTSGDVSVTELKQREGSLASSLGELANSSGQRILEPGLLDRLQRVHPAEKKATIANALTELVKELTGSEELPDPNQTFLEAGMDSLMLVELVTQLQMEMQTTDPLPATLIFDYPRISDLSNFIFESTEGPSDSRPNGQNHHELPDRLADSERSMLTDDPKTGNGLMEQIQELSEEEALEQLMKELE